MEIWFQLSTKETKHFTTMTFSYFLNWKKRSHCEPINIRGFTTINSSVFCNAPMPVSLQHEPALISSPTIHHHIDTHTQTSDTWCNKSLCLTLNSAGPQSINSQGVSIIFSPYSPFTPLSLPSKHPGFNFL